MVFNYKHPGVIKILKLMTPLVLGMFIYRAIPIFDRYFLSKLTEGSISHIGYAMQLMSVMPTLIVSGISVSIFPMMSKYAAEHDWDALRDIMSKGIRMLYFLSIPFVVILGVYGRPLIQMIFERKAFISADTTAVYYAFAIYLLGLPAMAIGSIIGQGYYVLQDTKIPVFLGLVETIIYIGLCFVLIPRLDYLAIPVSYAAYFNLSLLGAFIVRYKLGSRGGLKIVISFLKNFCAAMLSLLVLYLVMKTAKTNIILICISIFMSFMIYALISRLIFRTEESAEVENLINNGLIRIIR
jgi:putative peptidoglycan lipid II flippase